MKHRADFDYSRFDYRKLEERKLLAVAIDGTVGDDFIEVEFETSNSVLISQNGNVAERFDVSDGLLISLGPGEDVVVFTGGLVGDQSFAFVEVEAEQIVGTTGNDVWDIRDQVFEDTSAIQGLLNQHISFSGANRIVGGHGDDFFQIRSLSAGVVEGSQGDDVFRLGANVSDGAAQVNGNGGNDLFVVRGENVAAISGGEGVDRISFKRSAIAQLELVAFYESESEIRWHFQDQEIQAERIVGVADQPNRLSVRLGENVDVLNNSISPTFILNGRLTRVLEGELSTTLIDFSDYQSSRSIQDRYYVLSTIVDLEIKNAHFVQIASNFDPAIADLSGINNQITLVSIENTLLSDTSNVAGNHWQWNSAEQTLMGFNETASIKLVSESVLDLFSFTVLGPITRQIDLRS